VGGGGHARVYDPGTADMWKSLIKELSLIDPPFVRGVIVKMTFRLERPKKHYVAGNKMRELREDAPHFVEQDPDLDNLEKAVMDALTSAFAWTDDNLVVKKTSEKIYSKHPGLVMEIREVTKTDLPSSRRDPNPYQENQR
jgi:Holliday junction resolvase RusA-like endonuclease